MATFYTLQQKSFHVNKEEGYAWCTLFFVEAAIVIALNMFAIIIFSTDRRVRKHSTYLLINLSAADVGVGALVIPASALLRGNTYDHNTLHCHISLSLRVDSVCIFHFLGGTNDSHII